MKPVPILRLLSYASVFGAGILVQRFLPPGLPAPSTSSAFPSSGPASKETEAAKGGILFDGTLGGLYQIAKEARSPVRAQSRLGSVLLVLPVSRIAELAAAIPGDAVLQWHEAAVRSALLQEWVDKDPGAALKWVAGLPKSRAGKLRLELVRCLAAVDAGRALVFARTISSPDERSAVQAELTQLLAVTDPEKALELIQSSSRVRAQADYGAIFRSWTLRDPREAWKKALSLPSPGRDVACWAVPAARAESDPAGALELASGLQTGRRKLDGIKSVFSAWAANDPVKARDAALALTDRTEQETALRSLIPRWANDDPAGALRAVEAMPKSKFRQDMLGSVYQDWAKRDPAAASAALSESSLSKAQKNECNAAIGRAWSPEDPAAAMRWARSLSPADGLSSTAQNVLSQIAYSDGTAALAVWKSLPADLQRSHLFTLVSAWASADVEGALAFARTLERPQDRIRALSSCANYVGFGDPGALTTLINEIPAGSLRTMTIRGMFTDPFGNFPAETVPWLRALPEAERTAAMRNSQMQWNAGLDASEMKQLLSETPGLADEAGLWASTARGLANEDPAAALAWAQSIESPAARRDAMAEALKTWTLSDPAAAISQARALTDTDLQKSSVRNIVDTWAESDPDGVPAWAGTATGKEREYSLLKASLAKSRDEPAEAARVISDLIAAHGDDKVPVSFDGAAAEVVRFWIAQDLEGGTRWVAQLPEGTTKESAAAGMITEWSHFDPIAASAWVRQLPAGGSRDAAAAALCNAITNSDPESAFTWALSIADSEKRDQSVRAAAESWRWQDKTAALEALQHAAIPENTRASLLGKIGKQD